MSNVVSFPGLGLEFTVNSVAFSFSVFGHQITVYWYGILIAAGFLLAIVYAMTNAKRFGLERSKMIDVIIGGTVGAIICARLYYVIFSWSAYKDDLLSIFAIWNGGIAIYGAVIGAFLVGGLMCKWRGVDYRDMFDVGGIGFLIGQCIGRWGNFINQEAFGINTSLPWGMTSFKISNELSARSAELAGMGINVDPATPVHPCFLYESVWCLIGFILLHFISKKRKFKGQVILSYAIWYGLGRIIIEGLRTDSLMIGSFRVSQVLSAIIVIVASIIMIVSLRRQKERESRELMLAVSAATSGAASAGAETVDEVEDESDGEIVDTDDEPVPEASPDEPQEPDDEPEAENIPEPEDEPDDYTIIEEEQKWL